MSDEQFPVLQEWGKALNRLAEIVDKNREDRVYIDASIQRFEFSFELGWKAIRACLQFEGRQVQTPREAIKEGYRIGWIKDEQAWLQMLTDRNL